MANTTTIQVRVDAELKQHADKAFKSMGLNMSTGINLFIHQVVNQGKIPFEITATDTPNMETRKVLNDVRKGKNLSKSYDSVEEMMADLDA